MKQTWKIWDQPLPGYLPWTSTLSPTFTMLFLQERGAVFWALLDEDSRSKSEASLKLSFQNFRQGPHVHIKGSTSDWKRKSWLKLQKFSILIKDLGIREKISSKNLKNRSLKLKNLTINKNKNSTYNFPITLLDDWTY